MRIDPRHVSALETMQMPSTANELLQFTQAIQWLRRSILELSTILKSLRETLEHAYEKWETNQKVHSTCVIGKALTGAKMGSVLSKDVKKLYLILYHLTVITTNFCRSTWIHPTLISQESQPKSQWRTSMYLISRNVTNPYLFSPVSLLTLNAAGQLSKTNPIMSWPLSREYNGIRRFRKDLIYTRTKTNLYLFSTRSH